MIKNLCNLKNIVTLYVHIMNVLKHLHYQDFSVVLSDIFFSSVVGFTLYPEIFYITV